ncbi:MAG: 5-bromo-4-chloroindolyl phosphate hydrolysis family protein [Pseudomonadota bacterium]
MSAKKFGGDFSPGGARQAPKFRNQKASRVDIRGLLLFVLPTPILLGAIGTLGSNAVGSISMLGIYAILTLAAWLLREGQAAQAAYDARQIARPPAFPRKVFAAGLTGIGVFGAVFLSAGFDQLIQGLALGAIAVGAHIACFGLDPMSSKGVEGKAAPDYVVEALDKAEARIAEITRLAREIRDREITDRVDGLMAQVREMLKLVEEDPRDLTRARRYFSVYLKGAEDATRKYAGSHERLDDPKLKTDYVALLAELEESFGRGREMLLRDDRADLEVEIEVLRERLDQESA